MKDFSNVDDETEESPEANMDEAEVDGDDLDADLDDDEE